MSIMNSAIVIRSSPMQQQQDLVVPPPTKTLLSNSIPTQHAKREADETSVVHITITAAGTVVYTQTATSYSYVATYSPVTESQSTLYPTNNNNNSNWSGGGGGGGSYSGRGSAKWRGLITGAIIGGVIGGVALITVIALVFFLMRRSRKKKREQQQKFDLNADDDDSYYVGHQRHASTAMEGVTGMTSLSPSPRHLVAPLDHLGEREGGGRESKYYQDEGGYYDDILTPPYPQQAFYSGSNTATSDSTTVEPPYTAAAATATATSTATAAAGFRQIPNQVDYYGTTTPEKHVPHQKDDGFTTTTIEPPHTRD